MLVLVDIGSSAMKWCACESDKLGAVEAVLYHDVSLQAYCDQMWSSLQTPQAVYVSHVGHADALSAMQEWVTAHWQVPLHEIVALPCFEDVTNAYHVPQQLGSDRWLNLIAAHILYPGDTVIVDCGSAMTLDVINAAGKHQGGLIVPGLYRQQQALYEASPGIQRSLSMTQGDHDEGMWLGRDTQHALSLGSVYAMAAMIDRVCKMASTQLDSAVQCLLSGADAATILPHMECKARHVDNLVLQGLNCVATHTEGVAQQ